MYSLDSCVHPWNVLSYEFSTKNGFNESKYNNMTGIEKDLVVNSSIIFITMIRFANAQHYLQYAFSLSMNILFAFYLFVSK